MFVRTIENEFRRPNRIVCAMLGAARRCCAAAAARRAAGRGVRGMSSLPRADREPGINAARTLPLAGPTYVVWGAGTDVGKTLISAAICNFLGRAGSAPGVPGNAVFYYKPVQTGFPEDSDADSVSSLCGTNSQK
jgi:hypothetical protein